jgi:Ca-activated chloride channel family protein
VYYKSILTNKNNEKMTTKTATTQQKKCVQALTIITLSIIIISGCGDSSDMASDSSYYNQKNSSGSYDKNSSYERSYDNKSYNNNRQEIKVEIEKYKDYGENIFLPTIENKISTFSVDADGASYANMRRFQHIGQNPPKESVRIEEYINYFTYDYENPTNGDMISLNSEISTCPWNDKNHLLRVGIKGIELEENSLPSSNYVFLIDVSGSMSSPEKLDVLKKGFKLMTDNLNDNDKVSIVTYASNAAVLLETAYGDDKRKIYNAIDQLGAGGSTAGAAGISTAYNIALNNFIEGGNNRIILCTDGDFNVGPSSDEELVNLIEEKRESGVYLTVVGVGTGNLNDQMMEQLANKGNGNYEYIDNYKQLEKVFVKEKSKFYTVATDCKIQLVFNQNKVESYRLIGYENRSLNTEDFVDDKKDAGEIGSNQTITAVYEVVLKNNDLKEEYASFDVRYKRPNEETSELLSTTIDSDPVNIQKSSEDMKFLSSVVGFGLLMKDSEYKGSVSKEMLVELAVNSNSSDPNGYKQEFISLLKDSN